MQPRYNRYRTSSRPGQTAKKCTDFPLTTATQTGKIHPSTPKSMTLPCKHPIVKVVAREDDIEFVECQNCGEVFDSAEYNDMALEEEETAAEARED
jgi:hypothetical protein